MKATPQALWRRLTQRTVISVHGVRIPVDRNLMSAKVVDWLYGGRYEEDEVGLCRALVGKQDRVLEIGAGLGVVSVVCAKACGSDRLLCYEANPALAPQLARTFALNGVSPELRTCALAQKPGEATFQVSDNIVSSSLVDRGMQRHVTVPCDAISQVIDEWRPTIIVCDAEGAEIDLFKHVDLSQVRHLILELHPHIVGKEAISNLIAELAAAGLHVSEGREDQVGVFSRKD